MREKIIEHLILMLIVWSLVFIAVNLTEVELNEGNIIDLDTERNEILKEIKLLLNK